MKESLRKAQEIAGMAGLKAYSEGDLLLVPFDLLRRNSASLFGIFALLKDGQGGEYLCVEELRDHANAVASLADGYEAQTGQDSL